MPYVPLPRFLVRAPLLPLPAFGGAARRLLRDPLGRLALELASPSLMARPDGASAARALDRYGRRAAFRTTPHGLLAGVTVGALGRGSRAATGRPRAHFDLGWARLAALGRALLDDGAVRAQIRLRHAPSLLRGPGRIRWLALDVPFGEERQAETDARLERILDASCDWAPWAALRAAARDGNESICDGAPDGGSDGGAARADGAGGVDADDDLDELLLVLIDDGLLHCDLVPPLIGPPAAAWMAARLDELHPRPAAAELLAEARGALAKGDLAQARGAMQALPGGETPGDPPRAPGSSDAGPTGEITAVLVHQPATAITLDGKTVQRAANLAPLLFRLQEALAPPAAERLADAGTRAAIFAAGELFGDGALDLQSLALGEYGVDPGDEADTDAPGPPPALLRLLVDAIAGARARGRGEARAEIALSAAALDAVLPAHAPPRTCELFLAPCRPARSRARGRPGKSSAGAGWLLGLHAPAGATWGRFAAALGEPLERALHELAAAEAAARPNEQRLDVAYAASARLADLGAHPPYRAGVLALSSWPASGLAPAVPAAATPRGVTAAIAPVITPADLELLAADGAAVALRARGSRQIVVPSPLGRVRSDTAPAGPYRLLAGWSLYRQHAPWALTLGPLADLEHVPRITIDGFVVSPASWRVPDDALRAGGRRALRRWRREAGVPRYVQIGSEDQLLPVDLDHPTALEDLTGQPRAWEIWPPIERGRAIDRDGRRLEAVIALVDTPIAPRPPLDPKDPRSDAVAAADDGPVPPPRLRPAVAGWQTFKLFGVEARQDEVLLDAAAPALREGLAAGEIDGWFFIRYFDGPGHRPHLRVRARAAHAAGTVAFTARLQSWLRGARAAGAVVDLEIAEYHPEVARFGGAAGLAAAELIFQSDSQLACELIASIREAQDSVDDPLDAPETVELLVAAFDALAAGMGLAIGERHRLARRRRDAHAPFLGEERKSIDAEYRARARRLRIALGAPPPGQIARALGAHRERVSAAVAPLGPAARIELCPALLHLGAVRLAGPQREIEARAYLFWERTLEGLLRSSGGSGGPAR